MDDFARKQRGIITEYQKEMANARKALNQALEKANQEQNSARRQQLLDRAVKETRVRERAARLNLRAQAKSLWKSAGKGAAIAFWSVFANVIQDWLVTSTALRQSDKEDGRKRSTTDCFFDYLPPNLGKGAVSWKGPRLTIQARLQHVVQSHQRRIAGMPVWGTFHGRMNDRYKKNWIELTTRLIDEVEKAIINNTECKTVDQKHPREYFQGEKRRCLQTRRPQSF